MTNWKRSTNIYEVNLRQYTPEGSFRAFAAELPRLKDMGVQVLWFMPITPIAQKQKKGTMGSPYACSNYTAVNPEFGSLADFKELVNHAQQLGLKVIIDWVANHTGWDHVWTYTHPEYYKKDEAHGGFRTASGMDDIIELDYANPAMRTAMIDAMKYWVNECGIDGFRCDLAAWVPLDFWQQARPQLEALKPLFWLGEFDELDNAGYGQVFDASYSWNWMHLSKRFCDEKLPVADLDQLLRRYSALGDRSMRAWFTSNHDENSWNGTEYEKYGERALPMAVFSVTWNGVPLLYSGQELPNRKRLAFFDKDPIEWNGQFALHSFYRTLLQLHATHPALAGGDPAVTTYRIRTSCDDQLFAYLRSCGDRQVLVLLNFSEQLCLFRLQDEKLQGLFRDVFSGVTHDMTTPREWEIAPGGYYVFEQ